MLATIGLTYFKSALAADQQAINRCAPVLKICGIRSRGGCPAPVEQACHRRDGDASLG